MKSEELEPKKPLQIVDGRPKSSSVAGSFGVVFLFAFMLGVGGIKFLDFLAEKGLDVPIIPTGPAVVVSVPVEDDEPIDGVPDLADFIEPPAEKVEVSLPAEDALEALADINTLPPPVERAILIPGPTSEDAFVNLLSHEDNLRAWFASDFKNTGHSFYGIDWDKKNVGVTANGLSLEMTAPVAEGGKFISGEMRTKKNFGYGRYEVVMRPAKGKGLVSAFFTYTGPYAGDPHDEIDFEFLGKDTTRVHLNYFRKGRVGPSETSIDLGFDASERPHVYAFEWSKDRIDWFIDNELVHSTSGSPESIPAQPGRIYISLWTGKDSHAGLQSWHGKYTYRPGDKAYFDCISYRPLGSTGRTCTSVFLGEESALAPPNVAATPVSDTP